MVYPSKISRKAAREAGLTHYFTGIACALGGISVRRTKDAHCLCDAHIAKHAERSSRGFQKNKSKITERRRSKSRSEEHQKYYLQNKDEIAAKQRERRIANPAKSAMYTRNYQARRMNATPTWFSDFDEFAIQEAYDLTKRREQETGIKHHVDHIVPLSGRKVCGLHCAANIQVIPALANRKKSNSHVVA